MEWYDYPAAAREAGITDSQLDKICDMVREDFPDDQMMFELHVLGACLAVRDGLFSPDELAESLPVAA